ncbi:MAG: DNA polymerase III subunit delta [Gemmatimonadaceae bacterium]
MSRVALQEFNKQVADKRFAAAYYFYGDEDYRKDAALQSLIRSAVEPSTRDFNLDQRRGSGLDARSLGTLLVTLPVLSERRMVVVRDAAALKKDARAVLDQYLRKPASDVVLVLISAAGEKVDANLQERASAIEFAPLDGASAVTWMIEHARDVHGARLEQTAADLLLATVGADLAALAAEIDKSVSYSGREIDTRAIEAVVGVRHGETLGDLLRAVAQRRAADALRLVAPVLAQPKNGLVPVLGALGNQLLAIGVAVAARNSGAATRAVRDRLWNVLKDGGVGSINTGGPWGEAVERWANAASLWTATSIREGLRTLLVADRSAKDSRVASDEQLLGNVVLALCGEPRRAAA